MVIRWEIEKEIRRRNWIKRAKRQKKRWFSAAFREKELWEFKGRAAGKVYAFFLWAGLGVLMLALSWEMFWRMGEAAVFDYPLDAKEEGKGESGEGQQRQKYREDRVRQGEILGIEIRMQDGKIVFFREKEEKTENPPFIR